ncbi:MAG: tetratricopeptide repeat protein [Candidatus Nitrohelix vancouverensis]|uniref:Tetratricopeptide repeat protein n=1 Tax=Candidatus Nitrohelix vancouverensis TaxID=2705534 RepID=A0A7T0C130_9BACT|nr:MAG: tetratricopeptide repeat protein [Candidatus Nitrohelix vancouverensis]
MKVGVIGPSLPEPIQLRNNPFVFILRLILFICLLSLLSCKDNSSPPLIMKANEEWIKGRNYSAIEMFKSVLNEETTGPVAEEALFRLGEIHHFSLGDSAQAIVYFKELQELNPKSVFAHESQRAIAEIMEYHFKDYDQAIIENQNLINQSQNPKQKANQQFRIAMIYYKMQNLEQSLAEHEDLIEEYPDSEVANESDFKILEILYGLGRCGEVENRYNRILKKNPDSKFTSEMEFVLASCLEEKGELETAYEKFKALEGRYPYPSLLQIKLEGVKKRIKKK